MNALFNNDDYVCYLFVTSFVRFIFFSVARILLIGSFQNRGLVFDRSINIPIFIYFHDIPPENNLLPTHRL